MKLTAKQQKDLETILYFIPEQVKGERISDNDIAKFFEYSDSGKHKNDIDERFVKNGFDALIQGKRWRGIHMQMYEEGILEGSVPYFTLLGGCEKKRKWYQFWKPKYYNVPIPRSVVDFMKKEMFKGIDSELIEKVYTQTVQKK